MTTAVSYTHLDVYKRQLLECPDGDEALDSHLVVVLATAEVVDDPHIVTLSRKVQSRRPPEVTIRTQNEDPQRITSCRRAVTADVDLLTHAAICGTV